MMPIRYRKPIGRCGAMLLALGIVLSVGVSAATALTGSAPTATTGHVVSVLPNSAVVTGTANPNGSATTWHFQYGLSTATSYTSSTVAQSAGSGSIGIGVTATLTGLAP